MLYNDEEDNTGKASAGQIRRWRRIFLLSVFDRIIM